MKRLLRNTFRRLGYDLVRYEPAPPITASELESLSDLSEAERKIVESVKPFTLTGVARIATLLNAVNYVSANRIPGDIAECGVWRGGSMMAAALALLARGETSRNLYLYDTYEGMSAPTDADKSHDGAPAAALLRQAPRGTGVWCSAGVEDVQKNLLSTGYPKDKIHLIKGKVEDTIPRVLPQHLSLLRLDTDWYESTKHELTHLFPILDASGILILDDYGHWLGARKAVDEYFAEQKARPFLHRIDCTGRILARNGAHK
jgi:O-methyltransferase